MSAPLVPSPLDYVGRRRFAFYPPIRNAQPNEWMLGAGSWAEVQVVNPTTGRELWVPRLYISAVSESGGVLMVELTTELEIRGRSLEPRRKRVIEMPRAAAKVEATDESPPPRNAGPAPVVGIRLEDRAESTMSKAIVMLGISALLISLLAALMSVFDRL
jgi:hypothetical protein